jgi:hypothetical protein
MTMLTADRLREVLDYDPGTGIFVAKVKRRGRCASGAEAGRIALGYRRITVDRRDYPAHRLAWLYVHGEWPQGPLDHVNRKRDDNRIANLRLATDSQNKANRPAQANSTSGIKGVYKRYRRWTAQICVQGRRLNLGTFATAGEAEAAYQAAAREHYGKFAA